MKNYLLFRNTSFIYMFRPMPAIFRERLICKVIHFNINIYIHIHIVQWLRYCATRRKVPASIPGRVTGDFFRSIRQVHMPGVDSASKNEYQDIPGGKGGRCIGVTTLPPSCAECLEVWEPQPPGPLQATQACNGDT